MASETVIYIAMSLDGYVADKSGGVDWLLGDGSEPENPGSYPAFYDSIDTVILGYNTYHQVKTVLSPDKWPYSEKQSYVLTHRHLPDEEKIHFVQKDLPTLLADIKVHSNQNTWICGGASLVNQFLKEGLVDRICVSVVPVILGDGIPLFEKRDDSISLLLEKTSSANGIVDLWYKIKNEKRL